MRYTILGVLASFLAVLFAPFAAADSPAAVAASHFAPTRHVVVQPGSNGPSGFPAPAEAQLNQEILNTNLPIYVAVVSPQEIQAVTPSQLNDALKARLGNFEGVITTLAGGTFNVQAFNVRDRAVADQAGSLLSQAINQNRGNHPAILSAFVTKLNALTHPTTSPVTTFHQRQHSYTWLWILLGVIVGIFVIVGLVIFLGNRSAKKEELKARLDKVKRELITLRGDHEKLSEAVLGDHPEISSDVNRAGAALASAEEALKKHLATEAESHLANVRSAHTSARLLIAPKMSTPAPTPPAARTSAVLGADHFTQVPEGQRRQASVRTTNPATGRTVTINNTNYRTAPTGGYNNFYGGGMYNGMYFYPGYYPYAFWGPNWGWSMTDMVIADELLADRWGGSYPDNAYYNSGDTTLSDGGNVDPGWNNDSNWDNSTTSADTQITDDGNTQVNDSGDGGGYSSGDSTQSDDGGYSAPDTSYSDSGSSSSWGDSGSSSSYSDSGSSYSDSGSSYSDSGSSYSSSDSGGGWGGGDSGGFSGGDSGGGSW